MDIEIKCYCDECGGVMNSEDEIFCLSCFSSLQDEILELQSDLGKTAAMLRDAESELMEIRRVKWQKKKKLQFKK